MAAVSGWIYTCHGSATIILTIYDHLLWREQSSIQRSYDDLCAVSMATEKIPSVYKRYLTLTQWVRGCATEYDVIRLFQVLHFPNTDKHRVQGVRRLI